MPTHWSIDRPTELQSAGTIWTLSYTHQGRRARGRGSSSPVKAPSGRPGARGHGQTYTWRFGMCVYRCRGGGESGARGAEWRVTYGSIYKKGAYKSLQVDSSDIPPAPLPKTNKQIIPEHTHFVVSSTWQHTFFFLPNMFFFSPLFCEPLKICYFVKSPDFCRTGKNEDWEQT